MTSASISFTQVAELSDTELIATSLCGGNDHFEELVRRYQRPITGYIYRMLGDFESSLDVTQEVFIKVYNSLSKYSSDYKFSTWLYRIAHNAAIDHIRRNSVSTQSIETENDEGSFELQLESKAPNPEQERAKRMAERDRMRCTLSAACISRSDRPAAFARSELRRDQGHYGAAAWDGKEQALPRTRNDARTFC